MVRNAQLIISHEHKFIFLKTRKVGGTSLEIALSSICGPTDIITRMSPEDEATRSARGYRGAQNDHTPIGRWRLRDYAKRILCRTSPQRYSTHTTASEARSLVGEEVWSSYFKFSIIRNPYDVAISRFFYSGQAKGESFQREFRQYLMQNPGVLVRNQQIYMIDGEPAVDQLVRYEALECDLGRVSAEIGLVENIYERMKGISSKTRYRPREATVDAMFCDFPEGKTLVRLLSRRELELGGYEVLD